MQAQIAQPEGSPTPNPRKKGRLLDPTDSLLDLTGHSSIPPPPRMEPLAPPTPAAPALPFTDDEVIGSQETTIPWSDADQEDLEMEAPTEPDKTLKDSTYASGVIEDQDGEQDEEEDEDMEDEEIETAPKELFERVWQGKMVLKAIEGGILSIESGKMTRKEKKLMTKTVVTLWDARAGGLCIDQHEIIENNALWMMDPAGWR